MSADERCVILFASIHDVMAAEKVLKKQSFWHDVVPTPRQLSSDCGMAVLVREMDLAAILPDLRHRRGVYRECGGKYMEVS